MPESRRYLGLELAGAKNLKTAVAILEHYPREGKTFLLDVHEKIVGQPGQTGDEALLELIEEIGPDARAIGVNVPLTLPPCITCTRRGCSAGDCAVPAVRWMRKATQRAQRESAGRRTRAIEFTPYTQRPVELYLRYEVFPQLPEFLRFEIDETLGGNRAPLTARMYYLQRHLKAHRLIEASPKLTVATLALELGLPKRTVTSYRHLEQGAHAREEILEALVKQRGVFIYERDIRKLAVGLSAFDSFVCAYTALLADNGGCLRPPAGFPTASGWIAVPKALREAGA